MEGDWDMGTMVGWSWLEMIAQLDEESMVRVVTGADGRSGGAVSCELRPRPLSYDRKRHRGNRLAGNRHQTIRLPRWDFLVMRDDDSGVRLHPEWNSPRFAIYEVRPYDAPVEIPARGLGRSDGRGTCARYRSIGAAGTARFDPRKGQHLPPHRQAPRIRGRETPPQ